MNKLNPDKLVLFDIDHTIFDSKLYRKKLFKVLADALGHDFRQLQEIAQAEYAKIRSQKPYLTPDAFLESILIQTNKPTKQKDIYKAFWDKKLYESCIYPDVKKIFAYLAKQHISIGIFSTGDLAHQKIKIESLKEYLDENHIYISLDKFKIIKDTFKAFKEFQTYILEDRPDILHEIKRHHKNVLTIWVKRDKVQNDKLIPKDFKPDATITHFNQLIAIINGTG